MSDTAIEALRYSEFPNSSDCISRQAAIDAIHCDITITGRQNAELVAATIGAFADRIKALPSAQPQRMRGKWTYGEDEYGIDGYHCDKCGFFVPWDYTHKFINFIKDYHFCPNCGADMRGEEECC